MTTLADVISGFTQKMNLLLGKVEIQKQNLDGAVAAAQESPLRNFKVMFGGIGDDTADNTGAFNQAEASTADWIYLPAGIYRTTHLQLLKVYIGEGIVRFADGYVQAALPPSAARPRSATGPVRIESPNDLVLAPVGDIQASGKRILNLAPGVFRRDAANMGNVADAVNAAVSGLFPSTQDWTPSVVGGTTAGVATYGTSRWGRITRIGNLAFVSVQIDVTAHTGTGQVQVTGLPLNIAPKGYVGKVLSGKYNPAPADWHPQTLVIYTLPPNRFALAFDVENFSPAGAQIDSDGEFSLSFSIFFEVAP